MNAKERERRGNSRLGCRQQHKRMQEAGKLAAPSKGWRAMLVQFDARTSGKRQGRESLAFSFMGTFLLFATRGRPANPVDPRVPRNV